MANIIVTVVLAIIVWVVTKSFINRTNAIWKAWGNGTFFKEFSFIYMVTYAIHAWAMVNIIFPMAVMVVFVPLWRFHFYGTIL